MLYIKFKTYYYICAKIKKNTFYEIKKKGN